MAEPYRFKFLGGATSQVEARLRTDFSMLNKMSKDMFAEFLGIIIEYFVSPSVSYPP